MNHRLVYLPLLAALLLAACNKGETPAGEKSAAPAADAVARFEQDDIPARPHQFRGGDEAGKARADDDDVVAGCWEFGRGGHCRLLVSSKFDQKPGGRTRRGAGRPDRHAEDSGQAVAPMTAPADKPPGPEPLNA